MATRIKLSMNGQQMLLAMSDGNPGAISVLVTLMTRGHEIDPAHALGGMSAVLMLDTIGIYGSSIWLLFNDVCKRDYRKMVAMLRACQLGFISAEFVKAASREEDAYRLDVDVLCLQVKERLPDFRLAEPFIA